MIRTAFWLASSCSQFVRVELRSQFGFRIIFQWFVRLELSVTVFADSQHRYSSASRLRF